MVIFYVTFRYALESCCTGPLNGHKYPATSFMGFHWEFLQERIPVCSFLIEGRPTPTACSEAEFGLKNIRWLSTAVSSASKFWPQVPKFFPSHVFTLRLLYAESLGVRMLCCVSHSIVRRQHTNVGAHWAGINSKSRNVSSQKENVC